jgi:DNA modification methylase
MPKPRQKVSRARQDAPGPTIGTLGDLTPDPANRRTHNPRNLAMLADALRIVGASRSIVVDEAGVILAGNGVVEAASAAGLTKLQIVDAELAIYDNRTAELAEWNVEQLAADLQNGEDLTAFFLPEELTGLLSTGAKPGRTDPDDVPEVRATDIQRGDLFELGAHRLLCGDATDPVDMARLSEEEGIDAGVTSPPYNAGVGITTGAYHQSPLGRTDFKPLYHDPSTDARSSDEYQAFLLTVLANAARVLKPRAPLLWNTAYNAHSRNEYGQVVFSSRNPLPVRETIVWDKGVGMNVAASGILSRTCELVFLLCGCVDYFTNQGPRDTWWNVWRISNRSGENQQHGHGASFPIGIATEAIERFSPTQARVIDPFAGSGTTLIACEQLTRAGRALEIEPQYVQVAIDRWEAFTGQRAVKVGEAVRA